MVKLVKEIKTSRGGTSRDRTLWSTLDMLSGVLGDSWMELATGQLDVSWDPRTEAAVRKWICTWPTWRQ